MWSAITIIYTMWTQKSFFKFNKTGCTFVLENSQMLKNTPKKSNMKITSVLKVSGSFGTFSAREVILGDSGSSHVWHVSVYR